MAAARVPAVPALPPRRTSNIPIEPDAPITHRGLGAAGKIPSAPLTEEVRAARASSVAQAMVGRLANTSKNDGPSLDRAKEYLRLDAPTPEAQLYKGRDRFGSSGPGGTPSGTSGASTPQSRRAASTASALSAQENRNFQKHSDIGPGTRLELRMDDPAMAEPPQQAAAKANDRMISFNDSALAKEKAAFAQYNTSSMASAIFQAAAQPPAPGGSAGPAPGIRAPSGGAMPAPPGWAKPSLASPSRASKASAVEQAQAARRENKLRGQQSSVHLSHAPAAGDGGRVDELGARFWREARSVEPSYVAAAGPAMLQAVIKPYAGAPLASAAR